MPGYGSTPDFIYPLAALLAVILTAIIIYISWRILKQKNTGYSYKNKKSVDFARVSSKKQAEQGYSLDAQVRLFKEYSQEKELRKQRQFIVPESAKKNQERKIFQEMMKYVKEHDIEVIVVEKVDRLTRDFRTMIQIDDWLEEDEKRQVHSRPRVRKGGPASRADRRGCLESRSTTSPPCKDSSGHPRVSGPPNCS
jgi:hypothetical protein